jgi:hypothetical protein
MKASADPMQPRRGRGIVDGDSSLVLVLRLQRGRGATSVLFRSPMMWAPQNAGITSAAHRRKLARVRCWAGGAPRVVARAAVEDDDDWDLRNFGLYGL